MESTRVQFFATSVGRKSSNAIQGRECYCKRLEPALGLFTVGFNGMNNSEALKFREGDIEGVVIRPLKRYCDTRGWLVELFRQDEVPEELYPVMAYASETVPGMARGPHEHADQTDFFAFIGPGDFKLYLWDTRLNSATYGNRQTLMVGQSYSVSVVIPPGVVHAYKNISEYPGLVFNAPNRLYAGWGKKAAVDEIRHEDQENSPFQLD